MAALDEHEHELDWDGHVLLIHRTEEERRSGVSAWVGRGLRKDAKVLYVEPPGMPWDRSLEGIIDSHPVPRAREALSLGQLQVVPPGPHVYTADGQRQLVEEALADGYSSLCVTGEVGTAHEVVSQHVHDDAESSIDLLCRSLPVSALCQYPAGLPSQRLRNVLGLHAGGLRISEVHVTAPGDRIRLTGELDICSAGALQMWLTGVLQDAPGPERVLDLSRLGFVDVAGYRAILAGSAGYRRRGGRMLVRGATGSVLRLFGLLGIETVVGMEAER